MIGVFVISVSIIGCSAFGDSGTYLLKPKSEAGLELPVGFPADVPIYPNATSKQLTSQETTGDGWPGTVHTLELSGDPQQIHDWYVAQFTAAGWRVDTMDQVPLGGFLTMTALSPDAVQVFHFSSRSGDSLSLSISATRRLDHRRQDNEAVTWVSSVDPPTRRSFFLIVAALLAWLIPSRMMVPASALARTRRRQNSLDSLVRSSRGLPWEPGPVARLVAGLGTFIFVALLGFPEWFPSTRAFILGLLTVVFVVSLALTLAFFILARSRDL